MTQHDNRDRSAILSWGKLALVVAAMVGGIGLALLLIEPLSLNAAIEGGTIAIGVIVGIQLLLRWSRWRSNK